MKTFSLRLLTIAALLVSPTLVSHAGDKPGAADDAFNDPNAEYDRLDGVGDSHKKVNVIEWEGNLEVHVYPQGSLVGLTAKIDEANGKKVMVIGYRFDIAPKRQYIRRYVLGIPMRAGFKSFRDKSADDYDKIILSNNSLAGDTVAYKMDPPPSELYPEGHPKNSKTKVADSAKKETRAPASEGSSEKPAKNFDEDSGAIRHFE